MGFISYLVVMINYLTVGIYFPAFSFRSNLS